MSETEIELECDLKVEIRELLESKDGVFLPNNAKGFAKVFNELPTVKRITEILIAETQYFVDIIDVNVNKETRTINVKFTLPVPVEINYEGDL